jgi:hypothetical protein
MAKYVRIRLANGDTRHATLSAGRDAHAQALIVELSLVDLDEQPTLDGVLPAQAASTGVAASGEARARARIFE